MNRKALIFLIGWAILLAISPGILDAQPGPGPQGPPPGGFGRGAGDFQVLGVEGCLRNGWRVPSGAQGYAAHVVRERVEPVLGGSPITTTNAYESYRDNNGVSYLQVTLPAIGGSQSPRTVICIYDPKLNIRLVVDPANLTAREYKLPERRSSASRSSRPPSGNRGNRPEPPGITHPAPPAALNAQISQYCPDAVTTAFTRNVTIGGNPATLTSERVFCPSLALELYARNSSPRSVSTTTATISAVGSQVDLTRLPVPYPLLNNYVVTKVEPRERRRRSGGPGGPPQP